MRLLKLVLACAFLLAGSSIAGSVATGLPGVGTFAYSGPAIQPSAPALVIATNER